MMHASTIGAANDYFDPLFFGFNAKNRTLGEREVELKELKLQNLPAKAQRTFRVSRTVVEASAPTAEVTGIDSEYLDMTSAPTELDDVRGVVRSFAELEAGWDGPDSSSALPGVVDDALEVLQNWSGDMDIPEPAMAFDGSIVLELYNDAGLTRGGVEFKGNRKAVYTVISETEILSSGTFNAGSPGEIIKSISVIRLALSTAE